MNAKVYAYCSSVECIRASKADVKRRGRDSFKMVEKDPAPGGTCPDCGHYLFIQREELKPNLWRRK